MRTRSPRLRSRRSAGSASTPSRRPTRVIPACRWRWRPPPTCSTRGSWSTIPPTRPGPTATASSSQPGTARRCSTRCSTWPDTTSRSRSCGASASGARRPPAIPSAAPRPPGSRRPRARWGRASPTGSGWRWPSASCASATAPSVMDHRIYGICSDGDLMEGVGSEAASLAGHLGLGRIVYVYDDNRITIDGSTDLSFSSEDVESRFRAYGWHDALGRGRQRPGRAGSGAARCPRRAGAAFAGQGALGDRLARAEQGRHRRSPRLAARRRGGAGDQARARPRPGGDLRGSGGGRRTHSPTRGSAASRGESRLASAPR